MLETRIKLQDVIEAVKKTNLKVIRGLWGDALSCGCPLLVLAVAHSETPCKIKEFFDEKRSGIELRRYVREYAYEYGRETYGFSYTDGFLSGFDGSKGYMTGDTIRYRQGHDDGTKLYRELSTLSPEEKPQYITSVLTRMFGGSPVLNGFPVKQINPD